jgi:transcriptional regulator with XRE-family HTH domain
MDVGKAIRDLRVDAGHSQDKLVALTGISRSQLYFIESGRCVPRIDTMEKIAKTLNIKVSDIILYAEKKYPVKTERPKPKK